MHSRIASVSSLQTAPAPAVGTFTPERDHEGPSVKSDATKAADARFCGIRMGPLSLFLLVLQMSSSTLACRVSRTQEGPQYLVSVAVLLTELLKLVACIVIAVFREVATGSRSWRQYNAYCRHALRESWPVSLPAFLFTAQSQLNLFAASWLDAVSFQVTNQLKILPTAGFSALFLGRQLTYRQWVALPLLALGVAAVNASSASETRAKFDRDWWEGLVAAIAAAVLSGYAGVHVERMLKVGEMARVGTDTSDMSPMAGSTRDLSAATQAGRMPLMTLNTLLAAWGSVLAGLQVLCLSGDRVYRHGMLHGFGPWAWAVVALQAIGGLVVSLVVKYTDNIVKGFAIAVSIIVSWLLSMPLFGIRPTPVFVVGLAMVVVSIGLFSMSAAPAGAPTDPRRTTPQRALGRRLALLQRPLGRTSQAVWLAFLILAVVASLGGLLSSPAVHEFLSRPIGGAPQKRAGAGYVLPLAPHERNTRASVPYAPPAIALGGGPPPAPGGALSAAGTTAGAAGGAAGGAAAGGAAAGAVTGPYSRPVPRPAPISTPAVRLGDNPPPSAAAAAAKVSGAAVLVGIAASGESAKVSIDGVAVAAAAAAAVAAAAEGGEGSGTVDLGDAAGQVARARDAHPGTHLPEPLAVTQGPGLGGVGGAKGTATGEVAGAGTRGTVQGKGTGVIGVPPWRPPPQRSAGVGAPPLQVQAKGRRRQRRPETGAGQAVQTGQAGIGAQGVAQSGAGGTTAEPAAKGTTAQATSAGAKKATPGALEALSGATAGGAGSGAGAQGAAKTSATGANAGERAFGLAPPAEMRSRSKSDPAAAAAAAGIASGAAAGAGVKATGTAAGGATAALGARTGTSAVRGGARDASKGASVAEGGGAAAATGAGGQGAGGIPGSGGAGTTGLLREGSSPGVGRPGRGGGGVGGARTAGLAAVGGAAALATTAGREDSRERDARVAAVAELFVPPLTGGGSSNPGGASSPPPAR